MSIIVSNPVLMLALWSLLAPIILTFIPPPELWRVARLVWAILAPVFFISSYSVIAEMMDDLPPHTPESLGLAISSLSLMLSVGLGCASSLIYRRSRFKRPRNPDEP